MSIDLSSLWLEDLKQLEEDVSKAIKSYEARRMNEARAAAEAAARKLGYALDEVVSVSVKTKGRAKYQHPENPALT